MDTQAFRIAIGVELRRARKARGWTRISLHARIARSCSLQTLATYEHGSRRIAIDHLAEICEALEITTSVLVARAEERMRRRDDMPRDLAQLAASTDPALAPASRWARLRLDDGADPDLELSADAGALLARLCGLASAEHLRAQLAADDEPVADDAEPADVMAS